MIFFVPAYDAATRANFAIAERILPRSCHALLRRDATRGGLLAALSSSGAPLFAMSHGRPDVLLAQDGGAALARSDSTLLGKRAVFAFACHTASELGRVASASGTAWWGYTGLIQAPEAPQDFLPTLAEIFRYICESFSDAPSSEARKAVLLRIAELCFEAEGKLDDLVEANSDLEPAPAYLCLLHTWQRLRIWEPGRTTPMSHPDAPSPLLFP